MVTRLLTTGFNWTAKGLLKLFWLIIIALTAGGGAVLAGHKTAQAEPEAFRDDFQPEPSDQFYWLNENPDLWRVDDGFLNLAVSSYPTGGENLLLHHMDNSDFVIETHLYFEPANNYQFAGLVIYQDDQNFLQLGRAFCDHEHCAGNAIYFEMALDGNSIGSNFATPVDLPDEAYLRLEKQANMVRGFYSADGTTWIEIGTHSLPEGDFAFEAVGLTASQDFWSIGGTAQFDYFEAVTNTATFRDNFSPEPSDPLYWLNENPELWRVDDGFLNLAVSSYPTGGENLLLYNVGSSDFMIKTHLYFEPANNYQFAGLVIYQDEQNIVQLGRAFCDHEHCAGNAIYFDMALDGNSIGSNFATPVDSLDEAYLRLEKRGNMVRGYYSADGTTWVEIGTHWLPEGEFAFEAVGLTASQDFWSIGANAQFDFFEVTTESGFLPEGYHDGAGGIVPNWDCGVGGWAADPDDKYADLSIMVTVDGTPLDDLLTADVYRQDLYDADVCADGTCSFWNSLWELITPYETHSIHVYAADNETEEWVQLYSTPKDMTCRSYDIYGFKPGSLETQVVSPFQDRHEFNPKWSPDGKMVVYDAWTTDWSDHGIYITNVQTGATRLLVDGVNTGNPAWAPNGRWIAFNRIDDDGSTNLYLISPQDGYQISSVRDAGMASWSPDSRRVVFKRPSDGSLMTAALDGSGEIQVAPAGNAPDWSQKDNWIAYELNGDIWKVRVSVRGVPQEGPVQLTDKAYWEGRVSWAPNGKSLIYHAAPAGDTDIWSIDESGGVASWLTGAPDVEDYDPSYSPKGRNVAYSSLSPDGQAPREWVAAYSYDPPTGTFAEGTHPYHFKFLWSFPEISGWTGQGGDLDVSPETPNYPGYALLRGFTERRGIYTPGGLNCEDIDSIHPMQPTRFLIGWLPEFGATSYAYVEEHFNSITAYAVWDNSSVLLTQHEIVPFYPDTWPAYVCGFTEAPMRMDLRVNYGHDWVESFYEAGHDVVITVKDQDGFTVKATAVVRTEPRDDWNGQTGFQTAPEGWSPIQPDIQPGDWVSAEVDNGVTAQVRIGNITGVVDLDTDSISGTILADWFDTPVDVECFPWGAPNPVDMRYDGIQPDGQVSYNCSWASEWDIEYWQDVGVGYFGQDGHWVANAFFVPAP